MQTKHTLGIDLGGTGIKLGLITADGKIKHFLKFSTPTKRDPEEVVALIVQHANQLLSSVHQLKIDGIGVGAAGDIDPTSGVVRISPNLNWRNVPLRKLLQKHFKLPVILDNDANAAAWATYVVETKRKASSLICVTLGTGVGGGIILNGALYRGISGSAGEIGHMTLVPEGIPCNCGNQGCLERYVGARAMSAETRRAIETGEAASIAKMIHGDLTKIEPYLLQKAARAGDPFAKHIWEQAGERLGIVLSGVINLLNPQCIVLAGGLSKAGKLLTDPLLRTIRKRAFPVPAQSVKILISKLDQDLGVVGAGLLAHHF